jgi:threonine/homoserine/homoserine lactone efflux protein
MIVLVGAGLAQIFERFPVAHAALKIISVVYLLWLAWKIANAMPPEPTTGSESARPMTFLQAALFQWVNPKAWTMALTAVSAYTLPAQPWTSLLVIAVVFGLINLPSVGSWALLGVQMRRFLEEPVKLRAFNITAALLLVASLYPTVFGAR